MNREKVRQRNRARIEITFGVMLGGWGYVVFGWWMMLLTVGLMLLGAGVDNWIVQRTEREAADKAMADYRRVRHAAIPGDTITEETSPEGVRAPCWMLGVACDHEWCREHGTIKHDPENPSLTTLQREQLRKDMLA